MNPEFGREPGDAQPGDDRPTGPQPPAYGPPPGFPPSNYPPQQGYPPQPGYAQQGPAQSGYAQPGHPQPGQWQPPMPPPGNAPRGRAKWLVPLLALAGVVVVGGGVIGAIALFNGSDPGPTSAATSQFTTAANPAEALIAATNVTLDSSPMVSRMSVDGTTISVTQIDYARGVSYSEQSGGPTAGATFYLDNEEMMIRFGEALALEGVDGNTWYRLDTDNPLFGMIGQSIAITTDRDSQRDMMQIFSTVEDMGATTFEGQSLTRLVATVDTEKFVDYSLNFAKEFADSGLGISDAALRGAMRSQAPTAIEYWIDGQGRIIKQITDGQVVVNSDFGEPLDIPEIPASAIEDFPFN